MTKDQVEQAAKDKALKDYLHIHWIQ
jgi:hypothetical protein